MDRLGFFYYTIASSHRPVLLQSNEIPVRHLNGSGCCPIIPKTHGKKLFIIRIIIFALERYTQYILMSH